LIDGMDEGDGGWEELRKEARKVEGDLDVKLSSYNKLGGMLAHGGFVDVGSGAEGVGGDGSWKSMEMEIESLLEKLLDINDAMSRCVAAAISTTSVTQKLARHRDILHEFTQVFCPSFSLARPLNCFTQYGWMDGLRKHLHCSVACFHNAFDPIIFWQL
jgi:hypothetical protein